MVKSQMYGENVGGGWGGGGIDTSHNAIKQLHHTHTLHHS